MKKYILLFLILTSASLVGCVTQNRPMYVWHDYSSSLYTIKKAPSDKNLSYHKDVLHTIIEESRNNNYRTPPGVYCEYGYILLKEGKQDEAFRYFDLEEQTYPESGVFIRNLKAYALKSYGKNRGGDGADENTDKTSSTDDK